MRPQMKLQRANRKSLSMYACCMILFLLYGPNQIIGQGTGLVGYYYSNDGPNYQFTAPLTFKRIDPKIDFNWGGGSPVPGIVNPESFSIRWIGKIASKKTGNHTFFLRGDDGVRLKINGQSLIDDWVPSGGGLRKSTFDFFMVEGKKYEVIIEHYEGGGGALIQFSWSATGLPMEIVPTSQLYPLICSDLKNKISPDNQTFCKSGPIQPLTGDFNNLALIDDAQYVWESSDDNITWKVIDGAKDQNLPVAVQDKDRWYRRLIKGKSSFLCDTVLSTDPFVISVSNVAFVKGSSYIAPKADAGKNIYACPGVPVKIGGSVVATGNQPPFTYSWNYGEFLNDKTLPNPIASVPNNTIFTLTVTDAVGCTNLHQMVLYANVADAGPDSKYCGNQGALPLGTPPNPGEPASYQWTPKEKLTCHDCPIAYTTTNVNTTYTLVKTVTLPDGSTCQTSDDVFVKVIAPPSKKLEDVIICYSNDNVVELGYEPEPNFSYVWKNTKYLTNILSSKSLFDCDDVFLDPQGRLGNPKNDNPATYILEIQNEVCIWTDTLQLFMLRADGGNSGLDGKLGYDWHPQIPASYKWKLISGPNTMVGPTDQAVAFLNPVDPTSVYQLSVSFRGVSCLSRDYVCNGSGFCELGIDFDKGCLPRPGLKLRAEGVMALPLGADPSKFEYEWFPKVGLSNYKSREVITTDNVVRKYEVRITHPDRPGAVCLTERVIPGVGKPTVNLPDRYNICEPGDSITLGVLPSTLYRYSWKGPNNFSSDTSRIVVAPSSVPATFTLTVIDTATLCEAVVETDVMLAVEADAGEDQIVCPGATVVLGTPDSSGGQWTHLWQPFFSPWQQGTNETSPEPAVLVAKDLVFVLTVTDTATGCTAVDSVNVTIDPEGPPVKFEDVTACLKSNVVIGPKPIPFAKYSWAPSAGLSCTDCPNPVVTANQDTKYSVEISLSGNCSRIFFGDIHVSVFDTTSIAKATITKCPSTPGGDVMLNPEKTGECEGCTYEWVPADGLDNPNVLNPTASNDKNQQYTLTITHESGCKRIIKVPVKIQESNNLGNKTIEKCAFEADVFLNPQGLGACAECVYSWTPSTGLNDPSSLNPKTEIRENKIYTLLSINSDGCRQKMEVAVSVNPEVVIGSESYEKCPTGNPLPINPNNIGGCPGCRYEWTPGNSLNNPTLLNPVSSTPQAINYTLRVIKPNGCVEKATFEIKPLVAFAGLNDNMCLGNSLLLGDPDNSLNSKYSWIPVTNLDDPTSRRPSFTPSSDGFYTFKMTEEREFNGSTCKLQSEVRIRVDKITVPSLPPSMVVCKGTCTEIGVDSLSGYKYQWSTSGDLNCSTCSRIYICPQERTPYKLTTIKLDNGCSAISEVFVDVAEVDLPEFETPDLEACLGKGDKISVGLVPSTPANYTIRWFPQSYFDNPTAISPNIFADSLHVGVNNIEFLVDDPITGCKNIRYKKEVLIIDPSEVQNQYQQFCLDYTKNSIDLELEQFDQLFKRSNHSTVTYYSNKENAEQELSQIYDLVSLAKDTTLYVRVEYPNAQCHTTAALSVGVYKSYLSTLDKSLCEAETFKLDNKILSDSGTYTFPYTSVYGCDSTHVIKINIQKIKSNFVDTAICKGDFFEYNGNKYFETITLYDTLFNQYGCDSIRNKVQLGVRLLGFSQLTETRCDEYTWGHNGITYDKSGIFSDTIRSLTACDSIVRLDLKINPSFYFKDNHPTECEEFIWDKTGQKFTNSGVFYKKYKTIGGCDSIYELNLTVNPSYRSEETVEVFEQYYWAVNKEIYTESGEYIETFTTANGCDSTIILNLRVKKYGKLWIPNIFSPNGDGSNDRFIIFSNPEVREIRQLRIYSRTGNLVFEKMNFAPNDPENGWDGAFLNRLLDPAVFAFVVEYEDIYGFKQTEAGSVTLFR